LTNSHALVQSQEINQAGGSDHPDSAADINGACKQSPFHCVDEQTAMGNDLPSAAAMVSTGPSPAGPALQTKPMERLVILKPAGG
jgi:hypothetical protein